MEGSNTEEIFNKSEIRRKALELRNALSERERKMASLVLTERICGHQWYYLSNILVAFVSYGSEIDTSEIIEDAWKADKAVFVPKICGDEMFFYRINNWQDLQIGYKGIREPDGSTEQFLYNETNAGRVLMLMPGVAFDRERNRIGYGKGFYDKFLADKEALQLRTIAVGFQCQMFSKLPFDENDMKPYQVICI